MTSHMTAREVPRDQFERWVHDALGRLYDTPYLQSHPLAELLVPGPPVSSLQRCQALRRVLLDAIQAIRPAAGMPAQSPDWRAFRILELRYIEGLGPNAAMKTLALARSQYFREQARAMEVVTSALWDRYLEASSQATTPQAGEAAAEEVLARMETERLSAHATWEPIDVPGLLENLGHLVEPLARQERVVLEIRPLHSLREVHGDRVMMRQAVLSLLSLAIELASGGDVEVADFSEAGRVGLRIRAKPAGQARLRRPEGTGHGLDVCRHLIEALGGSLRLHTHPKGTWEADIVWVAQGSCILLVVDDNQGLIELFCRYLSGHGWQVIGAGSALEARRILSETRPTAIALDVMMPGEDGWDLLTSLKADTETRDLPVIVCSVLDQPELARSLGAVAYLPKPVTQQALLQTLAQWSRIVPNPAPKP